MTGISSVFKLIRCTDASSAYRQCKDKARVFCLKRLLCDVSFQLGPLCCRLS